MLRKSFVFGGTPILRVKFGLFKVSFEDEALAQGDDFSEVAFLLGEIYCGKLHNAAVFAVQGRIFQNLLKPRRI